MTTDKQRIDWLGKPGNAQGVFRSLWSTGRSKKRVWFVRKWEPVLHDWAEAATIRKAIDLAMHRQQRITKEGK